MPKGKEYDKELNDLLKQGPTLDPAYEKTRDDFINVLKKVVYHAKP
jgi:hypothetical protein